MSGIHGVVVGHGGVAQALVEAAEEISGLRGFLRPVSNQEADRDTLETLVYEAVGGHPAIVFVDLPSGSCLFAAMKRLAGKPEVRIVTGANLAMLLDFLFHRELPLAEVARRAAESGSRAIGQR